jgi:hypothetical protein
VELDLSGLALRRERRVDVTHQGIAAAPPPCGSPRRRCCIAM